MSDVREALDGAMWERKGAIEVCRSCGFVREGTADATLRHRDRCGAAVMYGHALVAIAAEREACAMIAGDIADGSASSLNYPAAVASAIRART